MAREAQQDENEGNDEIEKTIDPYTGELVPVPEDADQFIEVVPEETDDRRGSNYLLNEETSLDSYVADSDGDAVAEQSAHFTDDKEIEEDFAERQRLAVGGREALLEELDEHNSLSPSLSGGDIDAAWQDANVAGEEAVGGSVSTPDQDVVDELGEGAGLTYKDDEPLDYDKKVLDRDRNRWELDPASADTADDELKNELDDDENEDEEDELEDDELADLLDLDEEDDEEDEDLDEDVDELSLDLDDDEDDLLTDEDEEEDG
jgi:hypothetical protein